MNNIVKNTVTLSIAIVGLIGGGIWIYISNWGIEPLILCIVSFIEIVGFLFLKGTNDDNPKQKDTQEMETKNQQNIYNAGSVNKQINIKKNRGNVRQ